ncbi:MAG: Clostripain family protein [Lachnospiraceae bacterium]|nr:Clostripain family protein [Lachnospiraceae bacterium]
MKRFTCIMLALILLTFGFGGCSILEDEDWEDYEDYEDEENGGIGDYTDGPLEWDPSAPVLSVDSNTGMMTVQRPVRESEIPMGEDGTWTVFVYLCGSDLESDGGMGTDDLEEMMSAEIGDNVRFVVQTGGASYWYNEDVATDQAQRFVIQNQEMTEVYSSDETNMGDTAALTDFLRWGVKEYPANHMGVVFWNHGGGSIEGVCFDENNEADALTLTEIDAALYGVAPEMTDRFEFIGFDACLMGTVETANVLASYSRYMYGSQEIEPGSGWDYTAIGNFLAGNPDADGKELGKAVCDSYMEACKSDEDSDIVTLAVIDLEALDRFLIEFNTFAKSMYEAGADTGNLSQMIREIENAENFGGNNKSEDYTNMVDLGALIEGCGSENVSGADKALEALKNTISYSVTGESHSSASGLSVYYPLQVQGSTELKVFETVCISPYYVSFIDRQNLGGAYAGGFGQGGSGGEDGGEDGYDEDYGDDYGEDYGEYEGEDDYWYDEEGWYDDSYWFDEDDSWSYGFDYEYDEESGCYRKKPKDENHWDYADQIKETGESRLITFSEKPHLNDEGIYTFTLDKRGLENTATVYGYVFQMSEDEKTMFEIGETLDVEADYDKGVFEDYFDGYWLSLPDGQNLATYIVENNDDFIIYTSPILLNGKETNLRLKQNRDGEVTVEGAWDGIDEHGASSRKITKLKSGDKIVPMYYTLDADTMDEGQAQGSEYVVSDDFEILYGVLEEADYFYAFCIDDIYYDYYLTEFELFHVDENGESSYYSE